MDELHGTVFQQLLDEQWKHGVEAAADVTLVSRYYERFADQAVSVGRRAVFSVTGERAADVARLAAL